MRLAFAAVMLAATAASAARADDLDTVLRDHWAWALSVDPLLATEVGDRSGDSAIDLMDDLRDRIANRVQITTDRRAHV